MDINENMTTKPHFDEFKPTCQLRWVEYNQIHNNKKRTPVFEGEILGHHYGETGYILQQKWVSENGQSEWRNIEIEYFP